jgi:hypothetical protein
MTATTQVSLAAAANRREASKPDAMSVSPRRGSYFGRKDEWPARRYFERSANWLPVLA